MIVEMLPPAQQCKADWPARRLFGFGVHALNLDQVLDIVDQAIEKRERLLIGVVNAAKVVNMRRDPALRDAVLSSELILADGIAVVWASRILRRPLPERVPGIDLMHGMLRRGNGQGRRVFCFGAQQDVLENAVASIRSSYPNIVIAGMRNGYYHPDQEPEIVNQIKASRADVLFVAMSPPKKEIFLGKWVEQLGVPVRLGVGGAFDVLAGRVRRAPAVWQRFGLEWLYRIKQEPRRMWRRYLVTNTLFCGMVLGDLMGRHREVHRASSKSQDRA